jgi:hypothetical protein
VPTAATGEDSAAGASVHGTAGELVLYLHDRIPADSLHVDGDAGLLDLLRAWEPEEQDAHLPLGQLEHSNELHVIGSWAPCLRRGAWGYAGEGNAHGRQHQHDPEGTGVSVGGEP